MGKHTYHYTLFHRGMLTDQKEYHQWQMLHSVFLLTATIPIVLQNSELQLIVE